ncbi:MAG: hypothetical protein B7Z66_08540 [Chromatiales bacterium 21-64-14]|nr:MAG: hypothetical protein B7Z66_08540 [Chromatiales bacterium 21-64-14]HQU15384.1 LapA family protein [Gammaproteobacteria bacterium]
MVRIVGFVVLVVVVAVALSFAVLNAGVVPLNFYFGTRHVPLALALVLAVVIGAVLGVVASLGMVLRSKREVLRLRRTARQVEAELENLRTLPIKHEH